MEEGEKWRQREKEHKEGKGLREGKEKDEKLRERRKIWGE